MAESGGDAEEGEVAGWGEFVADVEAVVAGQPGGPLGEPAMSAEAFLQLDALAGDAGGCAWGGAIWS